MSFNSVAYHYTSVLTSSPMSGSLMSNDSPQMNQTNSPHLPQWHYPTICPYPPHSVAVVFANHFTTSITTPMTMPTTTTVAIVTIAERHQPSPSAHSSTRSATTSLGQSWPMTTSPVLATASRTL